MVRALPAPLHGVKSELQGQVKTRLESALMDMDLVSREEYEVVREIAIAAREENALLLTRLDALENDIKALKKKKK